MVERGDPEGHGTLRAPGDRSPSRTALSRPDEWAPVVQPVSPELMYPYAEALWKLERSAPLGNGCY